MSRSTHEILREAVVHFERMQAYAADDLSSQLVIDAVCLRLSAGLESLNRLEPGTLDELFGADWPLMWGMRNRIAHGYLLVDADIVRRTVEQDIPTIVDRIGRINHRGAESVRALDETPSFTSEAATRSTLDPISSLNSSLIPANRSRSFPPLGRRSTSRSMSLSAVASSRATEPNSRGLATW